MPTSADGDRMMDWVCGITDDPLPLLPSKYIYVATAGTGTYSGSVHFCLHTQAMSSARSGLKSFTDISTVCETLTKQLVAVNICVESDSLKTLATELEALQAIETYTQTERDETCSALFALLDHGQCLDSTSRYIITSTLPIVCTSESLKSHFSTLPEVFTWLTFAKLTTALHWLHNTCQPGIAHGDLHSGNILVGYSSLQHANTLPDFKLIDLGCAVLHPPPSSAPAALIKYNQALRSDHTHFLRILGHVVGLDIDSKLPRGWEWCDVNMVVEEVLRKSEWDHEEEVGKMERRWGGFTEGEVGDAKELDVWRIWNVVVGVTEGKRGEVRAKIEELLEKK